MTSSAPSEQLRIGTLGWARLGASAPARGAELRDYAAAFDVVEVNTTFYRTPTAPTFARWAERTPPGFRFALELPERVCRQLPFGFAEQALHDFLSASAPLGVKLALVVVHLPAHFVFDELAQRVLSLLKAKIPVQLVCEPHDPSWLAPAADRFLAASRIPRIGVLQGPALSGPGPGGWRELEYLRVRRLPRRTDPDVLAQLQAAAEGGGDRWWIFDKEAAPLASALATWSHTGDLRAPLNRQASRAAG